MTRLGTRNALLTGLLVVGAWDSGFGIWDVTTAAQAPGSLRLIVVLVADQLRADHIDTYRHRWRGGVRMLLDEGAWFTQAEYPYLNTATCVGHATIATGALPRTHGIVLNRWWHRDEQRAFSCTDDETAPDISYGGPVRFGNSARRMLVPTLADRLRQERPGARVVALSLKARGAIPLAGHGGDVVTWFDEPGRAFVTSRAFVSAPVESVATFILGNPPEIDLGRVWSLQDREHTYRHPDLGAGERPKAGWTAAFPHPLIGLAGPDAQFFDRWQKSPLSDAYLGRMATALVDDLQLGQRQTTDYLAISFSALDLAGHDFGTDSREVEDLLMRLDGTVGALLTHLDARVGRDNYVVALTADHGAAPTPEQSGGGRIAGEDVQQLLEQALIERWGPPPQSAYVPWVSSGSVYFGSGVYDRLTRDETAMRAVMQRLRAVPGMMRVLRGDEIAAAATKERRQGGPLGRADEPALASRVAARRDSPGDSDPLVRAAVAGFVPGRTADLLLVPRRHWVIELRAENEATNHGTFHDYDRRVPILLRGHRVRNGRYGADVTPADIAPTLAYLAGVTLANADGRVLPNAIHSSGK